MVGSQDLLAERSADDFPQRRGGFFGSTPLVPSR